MADEEQKKIFSRNLNNYLSLNNKTQKEVADAIGVSPQTFNTWCQGIALPRMGKVQLLADYFNIGKTDLIDEKQKASRPKTNVTLPKTLTTSWQSSAPVKMVLPAIMAKLLTRKPLICSATSSRLPCAA